MTQPFEENSTPEKKPTGELGLGGDSFVRQGSAQLDRGSRPLMDPELGEDFFERQAREEKARANKTRPLSRVSLHTFAVGTVEKAQGLIGALEPRVELLMRACELARVPIPGVEAVGYRHSVTPNTLRIVNYVSRAIVHKPALLQRVQVAVFRFHEASAIIARVQAEMVNEDLEPGLIEELKLKFYYLQNYHEEFKIDPVLTQVFPPPQDAPPRTARAASGQISPAELAQQRQALDGAYQQAQQTVATLAGHLALFMKGAEMAEQNKTGNLGGLFGDPATKRVLALAKAIKGDPLLLVKIKGDRKLYDELLARTKEHYRAGQLEALRETLDAFQRLFGSWQQHPVLKTYMAPLEAAPKKKG